MQIWMKKCLCKQACNTLFQMDDCSNMNQENKAKNKTENKTENTTRTTSKNNMKNNSRNKTEY